MGGINSTKHLDILIEIARQGRFDRVKLSTPKLSSMLGLSQQSASRLLKEMDEKGLVERKVYSDGQVVRITNRGQELLRKKHEELSSVFSVRKTRFTGKLAGGLGKGGYFVGLKGYRRQFSSKLGFIPYAGTLNLKVSPSTGRKVRSIPYFVMIEGFSTKKKSFGPLKCSKAKIEAKGRSAAGAVVLPFRTVHGDDIVEVIAPDHLRKKLRIKDGDDVKVIV
ncbi:MAG: DUF120 domain-containing protein [Candidatus Woesearchaeota archaeon]